MAKINVQAIMEQVNEKSYQSFYLFIYFYLFFFFLTTPVYCTFNKCIQQVFTVYKHCWMSVGALEIIYGYRKILSKLFIIIIFFFWQPLCTVLYIQVYSTMLKWVWVALER